MNLIRSHELVGARVVGELPSADTYWTCRVSSASQFCTHPPRHIRGTRVDAQVAAAGPL